MTSPAEFWDVKGRAIFVGASLVLVCFLFILAVGVWFGLWTVFDWIREMIYQVMERIRR